jgi:uncharacterized protein (TIGR03083 family)
VSTWSRTTKNAPMETAHTVGPPAAQIGDEQLTGHRLGELWSYAAAMAEEHFTEAATAYVELVATITPDRWAGHGLGEWDLRALVGHTSRSLITVETYLQNPAATEDLTGPAAYLAAVAAVDHSSVVDRGRAAGEALGDDPAVAVRALVDRVLPLVAGDGDPLISTLLGGMRLRQYLPTRTFELVVHGLDIARALDRPAPAYSAGLLSEVLQLTAVAAVLRGDGPKVLLALTGRTSLPPRFSVV